MRYWELKKINLKSINITKDSGKKLTLRDINKLRKLRELESKRLEKQYAIRQYMYGDNDDRAQMELEQDKLELEALKQDIELIIAKAELDADSKQHITDLATKHAKRSLKL